TRAPSTATARDPSGRVRSRRLHLRPPLLDDPDHALRGLLDRELRDLDHRTTQAPVDRSRLLQLLVDLEQLRVGLRGGAEVADPRLPDLRKPSGLDREAHDLRRVDLEE